MSRRVAFWCLGLALAAGAGRCGEIVIVDKGRPLVPIVIPAGEVPEHVTEAAQLLRDLIAEVSGAELPIVTESDTLVSPALFVGNTHAAQRAGIDVAELRCWSYVKRAAAGNVYILGNDAAAGTGDLADRFYAGTYKAVTSFLEEEVGVRFLLPGPNGRYVPQRDRIVVPSDMNVSGTPHFEYCMARPQAPAYDAANNYFQARVYKSYGGHSHYKAVPREVYGESHPEYFRLSKGKRDPSQGHLCVSNPEVQRLMVEELTSWFERGYRWVQLAQTDGYRACECDACTAIAEDPGERLWIVHCDIAEHAAQAFPDRKVVILAYGPTVHPPKTMERMPPNVMVELCGYDDAVFEEWQRFDVPFTVYMYNWGAFHPLGFLPKRTPAFAAAQVRRFVKNGVLGTYKCGYGEALGLEGPVYYVYGKLMGDCTRDPDVLADEFYRYAYGAAAASMKAFFDTLHASLESYPEHPPFMTRMLGREPDLPKSPVDVILQFFSNETVAALGRRLTEAESIDVGSHVAARLRLVRREFDYLAATVATAEAYRQHQRAEGENTLDTLCDAALHRQKLVRSFYDADGTMIVPDGWPRFFANKDVSTVLEGGTLHAKLPGAFSWNIEAFRAGVLTPNGDFELGRNWPSNWRRVPHPGERFVWETEGGIDDSRCVKIGPGVGNVTVRMGGIPLSPDKTYTLSASIQGPGTVRVINNGWTWNSPPLTGRDIDDGWQHFEQIFTPKPSRNGAYEVVLMGGPETTFRVDNIVLKEAAQ
jgi:hypothetical protein